MNPLSDLGMSDKLWKKFNAKFVKKIYKDEEGNPIICSNCSSGEPISLHHVFVGWNRNGKLIHDYGTQGMFSCWACSQRRVMNVFKRLDKKIKVLN